MNTQVNLHRNQKSSNRAIFTLALWVCVFAGFYYRLYATYDVVDSLRFQQDVRSEKEFELRKEQSIGTEKALQGISEKLADMVNRLGEYENNLIQIYSKI